MHSAKKRYSDFVAVVGKENAPATLDKYYDLKYNNPEEFRLLRIGYQRMTKLINDPALKLPNAESAYADDKKFTQYLFGGSNEKGLAKGRAFTSRFGYNISNWESLREKLLLSSKKFPAKFKEDCEFGKRYEQKVIIYGINGRLGNVKIGWIVSNNDVHLTTAFLEEI